MIVLQNHISIQKIGHIIYVQCKKQMLTTQQQQQQQYCAWPMKSRICQSSTQQSFLRIMSTAIYQHHAYYKLSKHMALGHIGLYRFPIEKKRLRHQQKYKNIPKYIQIYTNIYKIYKIYTKCQAAARRRQPGPAPSRFGYILVFFLVS